jgi:hypothetical protein
MRDDLAVKTGQLIAGDFTSPSMADEEKVSGSYIRIQKGIALGMDAKEARTLWLKQAINSDDIGLISQLQKMSETGALRRLDGTKETLTVEEYGSLEDAKDRIIQSERRDRNAADTEQARLTKAADTSMRNIVVEDDLPTAEKDAIAYVRDRLGEGQQYIDNTDILAAINTIRTLRKNAVQNAAFRTDDQKTRSFVKAVDILRNTDNSKMELVAGQLATEYGMTVSEYTGLMSAAVRMSKEGSLLGSGNLDSTSKAFGKNQYGNVDGDGILIKDNTIMFIRDVELNKGTYRDPVSDQEITVDLNTTQGKARVRRDSRKYALLQYAESTRGKELKLGPDHSKNTKGWNQDFLGTSRATQYKIMAEAGIPGFSLDTLQPTPAPNPNVRPPDATAKTGSVAAAQTKRLQAAFDRKIRTDQITADSVTLNLNQLQAAAEELRGIVETPLAGESAYRNNPTFIAEARAKHLRKRQEEAIKAFFNLDYGLYTNSDEAKQRDSIVKAVLDYISGGKE